MKYLEGGSTGAAKQGGLKAEATKADLVTRRRRDDRQAIFDGDEGKQRRRFGLQFSDDDLDWIRSAAALLLL